MHPDTVYIYTNVIPRGVKTGSTCSQVRLMFLLHRSSSHPSVAKQLDSLFKCCQGYNGIFKTKSKGGVEDLMAEQVVRIH